VSHWDLRRLDLQLLITLSSLLETRSTVQTSDRLGRTQSAISHALNRLRDVFDDPLFVKKGWTLVPTSRALALATPVARLLADIQALVDEPDGFDPATSHRHFRIAAPDFCVQLLAPAITATRERSPGLTFSFDRIDAGIFDAVLQNATDLAIAPHSSSIPQGLGETPFMVLDWSVFFRAEQKLPSPLTVDAWIDRPHVQVSTPASGRSPVDDAVASLGLTRTIVARVPDFLSAVAFVANGDALFTAPRQPFERMSAQLSLRQVACPVDLPSIPLIAYWNMARSADTASAWLRSTLLGPRGRRSVTSLGEDS